MFLFLYSFIASCLLTYGLIRYFLHRSILDIPNERSSHARPVPRGGGLAFVFVFYGGLLYLWMTSQISPSLFFALLGGIPIAIIGYLDDLFSVRNTYRFLVHVLSAIWAIVCLGGIPFLHWGPMDIHGMYFFPVLAAVSIIWFVNFYNFMDGIDGLAALQAIFVACVAGFLMHSNALFLFAAAIAGFLVWNWSPAKIFMGDVGSGFIGYILAIFMWSSNNTQALALPVWGILSLLFITDATLTLLKRAMQKKSWYSAHREHLYQRFVQVGYSHRQVSFFALGINLVICLPLSFLYLQWHTVTMTVIYLIVVVFLAGWIWHKGIKFSEKCKDSSGNVNQEIF